MEGSTLGKIASWLAIGAGTVLSVISAGTLAPIGIPLIAAGGAGLTASGGSTDTVSNTAKQLDYALSQSYAVTRTTATPPMVNNIIAFIQQNFLIILAAIAVFILVKPFKRFRK